MQSGEGGWSQHGRLGRSEATGGVGGRPAHLELPVVVLEAGRVAVTEVGLGLDARLDEVLGDAVRLVVELVAQLVARLGRDARRDDDDLELGDARGEDEALVVAVDHDHDAERARREAPRVLPHVQLVAAGVGRVLDRDVEHLGEVLAEAVRRAALDAATRRRDEALDRGRVEAAGKLLLLRLDTGDDGDGEELLVHAAVQVEDLEHLLVGLGLGLERRVALLPQELARAQERLCGGQTIGVRFPIARQARKAKGRTRVLELPAHDRVPLVELEREVTVRADPLRERECSVSGEA